MYRRPTDPEITPGIIVMWIAAALIVAYIIYHGATHKQPPAQHSSHKV